MVDRPTRRMPLLTVLIGVLPLLLPIHLGHAIQLPGDLAGERREFAAWIMEAPNSPFAALVQRPIGPGLMLGPADADIPLEGITVTRVRESGRIGLLEGSGMRRVVPRLRNVLLGAYRLYLSGPPGKGTLTVYGPTTITRKAPSYYPYDPDLVLEVTLVPPQGGANRRILASDGTEVDATEAGTVEVSVAGTASRLRVMRIPVGAGDERELEIYFRDRTNGKGSYPAGRFVTLLPLKGNRYRLDFNRARNPFCAYSTVFPCPAPWRGNSLETSIEAGEQYSGGGLEVPLPSGDR